MSHINILPQWAQRTLLIALSPFWLLVILADMFIDAGRACWRSLCESARDVIDIWRNG